MVIILDIDPFLQQRGMTAGESQVRVRTGRKVNTLELRYKIQFLRKLHKNLLKERACPKMAWKWFAINSQCRTRVFQARSTDLIPRNIIQTACCCVYNLQVHNTIQIQSRILCDKNAPFHTHNTGKNQFWCVNAFNTVESESNSSGKLSIKHCAFALHYDCGQSPSFSFGESQHSSMTFFTMPATQCDHDVMMWERGRERERIRRPTIEK